MEDYIQDLQNSGLTEYESRVYCVLLRKNSFTATEISRLAEVPRTKVYYVLEQLIKKGMCVRIPGKFKIYKAIEPKIAISSFINEIDSRKEKLLDLQSNLDRIYESRSDQIEDLNYVDVIRDGNLINNKLRQMEKEVVIELIVLKQSTDEIEPDDVLSSEMTSFNPEISYTYIYEIGDIKQPGVLTTLKYYSSQGVNVRLVPNMPVGFTIFDNKKILVSLQDNQPAADSIIGIFSEHRNLISAFIDLYRFYYNQSITLADYMRAKGIE